jgi:hypothetical protein
MNKAFLICLLSISALFLSGKTLAEDKDIETTVSDFTILLSNLKKTITIQRKGIFIQKIELEESENNDRKITVADVNFDGIDDILITGDEGNVQKFSNVYLFSKIRGKFELNKSFSEIPCITVDKSKKTLSGECFHTSACENWVEIYNVGKYNRLRLIEKKGFYCEPETERSYQYTEKYKNGKLIQNKIVEVKP